MEKDQYLNKLRMFLADAQGKIWSDTLLEQFLDKALQQYCKDSGAFCSSAKIHPDDDGAYHYPENFVSFMIGWNAKHQEITPGTGRELFIKSGNNINREGDAQYIYDDLNDYGTYSLYPCPQDMEKKSYTISPVYGEITDSQYGVFLTNDYGVTLDCEAWDYAGTIYFHKIGYLEDVKDYMAIIYCAMSLAYGDDSDFANSDLSAYYKQVYKSRISAFSMIKHDNAGETVTNNFY